MSVKIVQHQNLDKLEKLINKALAAGDLRFHSVTSGQGLFIAVLEAKPQPKPAAKPKAKPATKDKR